MRIEDDPDIVAAFLKDESGLYGSALGVARPTCAKEVADFVMESFALRRKLLPVGAQTAVTGAAVPQGDVVLSMRGMAGVLDIDTKHRWADVLPGTLTFDMKQVIEAQELYYPPDPTSEHDCTIGGNVATNASGARSFRFGMTARWIEEIDVVTGTGDRMTFSRRHPDKDTAGYGPFLDPVSLFVGSEGTLGVITRIRLRLMTNPGPAAGFLVFFPSERDALDVAVGYRLGRLPGSPRCVEWFDAQACRLLTTHSRPPVVPVAAKAALYLELDVCGRTLDAVAEDLIPLHAHHVLWDATVPAWTTAEQAHMRDLRHHVPEALNHLAAQYHANGGLKVSTEFCVPAERLHEMLLFVRDTAAQSNVDSLVCYGHVGNAHPHIFMVGKDPGGVACCRELAHRWCRRAVEMGGTVAGEHGVGKTRRDFLRHVHSPAMIAAMREVKRVFDPGDVLSIGNLFPETPSMVPEFPRG